MCGQVKRAFLSLPWRGHVAKQFTETVKCDKCNKPHATILHFECKKDKVSENKSLERTERESKEDTVKTRVAIRVSVCHASDSLDETTSSLILPVFVSHKDNSNKRMITYAVLDDQIDSFFVTTKVCKELDVSGPETLIKL